MRKSSSTNFKNEKRLEDSCGLAYAMILLKGRWTFNVLWSIFNGADRYGVLLKTIEGISEKMLSQSLKDLEAKGLIDRNVDVSSKDVRYSLTQAGEEFIPLIKAIDSWGNKVRPFTRTLLN
ncbi:MAG: helix-turn-helix transcriptional regulator [Flavobacteriaceae bacterium]|nr:helix-turn-helix transcriptional regulator [Flavobacteriaceae bacterium]